MHINHITVILTWNLNFTLNTPEFEKAMATEVSKYVVWSPRELSILFRLAVTDSHDLCSSLTFLGCPHVPLIIINAVVVEAIAEIKAALVPQNDLEVGAELAARAHKPPTSMQFLSQLHGHHAGPITACRYKGVTYVGLSNGAINKVDNLGNITANFINLSCVVLTIRAHMDQLFILEHGQPYKIHVYDLTGHPVNSWNHTDTSSAYQGNKLFLSKNEVFVADAHNQQIVVYNSDGKLIQNIPCPAISRGDYTSMCSAGNDCMVITSYNSQKASKVNIKSGAVLWTTTHTNKSLSSVCVGQTVLVGQDGYFHPGGVRIEVLNTENGER